MVWIVTSGQVRMSVRRAVEPNDTPRDKANQVIGSLWERNIGPLSETPAVRDAIFGLTEGTEDLRDSDGKSFWDTLSKASQSTSGPPSAQAICRDDRIAKDSDQSMFLIG